MIFIMRAKLNGFIALLLALFVHPSFAQDRTIYGTVEDESGPLPGVTVLIKGTTLGTETDFDGNYTLTAKTGDVLVFSYVGLKTVKVEVDKIDQINVSLLGDELLEEVVVVGYGTTTKKSYTGTAAKIAVENIESKSFSNISQALAGEVAGVSVFNTSGQPGTVSTVRIRGYGSPNGNRSPLYVVDGVPYTAGSLNAVNPNDIEGITLLKDATATAIYGSRGANGVILITTKKGTLGEEDFVEVDVRSGLNTQMIPRYDVVTSPEKYVGYVWEGIYNAGTLAGEADPVGYANGRLLTGNGIGTGYNMWNAADAAALIDPATRTVRAGVERLFTPERYADIAFNTGFVTETNVRFGGGNVKNKYYVSVGYLNDEGYSINSDYKRYTTRLNLDSKVKKWLKLSGNIGYTHSQSTNNGQTSGSENVFEFADKMAPIYPVYARHPDTGELIPDQVFGGNQYDYGSPTADANGFTRDRPNANQLNPIASAVLDYDGSDMHGINGNYEMHASLLDGLSLEMRLGGQYSFFRRYNAKNHVYGIAANSGGSLSVTDSEYWSHNFLQLLRYKKDFGQNSLEALLAHETTENGFHRSAQTKETVVQPGVYVLSNYKTFPIEPSGYKNFYGLESYFGQVNYDYSDKYFFTASLRTDGSSRFINDKWGVFGSVGGAWVISEEDFMSDSFFSYLKAKMSWGVTGDQDGVGTTEAFTTIDRNYVDGLALPERRPGNPDLTWETSRMFQAGLEMSLGEYVDANFDYYRKNTDNLFFNQFRGSSVGFLSIKTNDGEVQYDGVEFDVTGHLINTEDFKLDVSLNGEFLSNQMTAMPIDVSSGQAKIIDTSPGYYAYSEGRSIFDFYAREWAGVDSADGMPMWYQYYDDKNDNGVLDAGEEGFVIDDGNGNNTNGTGSMVEYLQKVEGANIKKTETKDYEDATEVYINKGLIPDVRGAFRISGKIKSFDFSTQFTYSLGGYAYDGQYAELMSDTRGAASTNFHNDIANRWQNPGDVTDVPMLSDGTVSNVASFSSRFITSTDYLALNNARIGYTVPSSFMSNSGIDYLNFRVSGDNLFINTAREGFNPTVRETGNSVRRIYAPASTVTLGVKLKF